MHRDFLHNGMIELISSWTEVLHPIPGAHRNDTTVRKSAMIVKATLIHFGM